MVYGASKIAHKMFSAVQEGDQAAYKMHEDELGFSTPIFKDLEQFGSSRVDYLMYSRLVMMATFSRRRHTRLQSYWPAARARNPTTSTLPRSRRQSLLCVPVAPCGQPRALPDGVTASWGHGTTVVACLDLAAAKAHR